MNCAFCKTQVVEERIDFRGECARCGGDLHICLNCRFYDQYVSRGCREPAVSEVEKDKERRNLCEYFKPVAPGPEEAEGSASEAARRKLEELFK